MLMKKKVLVTGVSGFVGVNLANELVKNYNVIGLDLKRNEELNPKIKFFKADIVNSNLVPHMKKVDTVFHTAALINLRESFENPLKYHQVNVTGTLKVLEASRLAGVRRIVYSSSMSVYNLNNPYSLTKFLSEEYLRVWSNCFKIETVSLRYFNFYGGRSHGSVIDIFLEQVRLGQPLKVFGGGWESRYFLHIKDLIQANIAAMKSKKVGQGEIIDIAGKKYRIIDVARLISPNIQKIPVKTHLDELGKLKPDLAKAKKLLNWSPTIGLKEGISIK